MRVLLRARGGVWASRLFLQSERVPAPASPLPRAGRAAGRARGCSGPRFAPPGGLNLGHFGRWRLPGGSYLRRIFGYFGILFQSWRLLISLWGTVDG